MDDDELTPEQKFAAEDAESMVPRALMRGRSREPIVADLLRLDWSPAAAEALVDQAEEDLRRFHESPEARARLVREAQKQFVGGVLTVAVGMMVVALVFLLSGFTFLLIPTGVLFVGLLFMARGWARWRLYRREPSRFEGRLPDVGNQGIDPGGRPGP